MGWHRAAIYDLVAADHPARAVWACMSGLDLGVLYDAVKPCEGVPAIRRRRPR